MAAALTREISLEEKFRISARPGNILYFLRLTCKITHN